MASNKHPAYVDSAGNKVPSVTTILSRFKDSGGLLYWANQQGLAGKTLNEAREPAATAGTIAHQMVECYLRGEPIPDFDGENVDVVAKGRAAYEGFLVWRSQTLLEIVHTEVALVSQVHRFGGRLDAIGKLHGKLVLGDWKSSNSVYADYILQLAGYKILWEENYPDHPLEGGFHLMRFAKEEGDFSHHFYPKLDREVAAFLTMRKLYDEVKAIEKRVK